MRTLLARLDTTERVGVALLLAAILWSTLAALLAGRMPSPTSPYVVAPVVLSVGVGLGRVLVRRADSPRVGLWLLIVVVAFLVAAVLTDGPATQPLGYANANAAVAVQLAALCGLAMVDPRAGPRPLLWFALAGAVAVVLANRSVAAIVVLTPLMAAISLMVWRPSRRPGWALAAGSLSMLAAAAGVIALGTRSSWPAALTRALDPARQQLWHDALRLWRQNPFVGGGPGSFQEFSALADDADTSAAHSSLLQVGSETGVVGAVLLALIAVTGLALAGRGTAPCAVVGVAAWSALGIHSLMDHLLEYPPVIIAAGMVLGWAGATRSEQLDVGKRESPVPG